MIISAYLSLVSKISLSLFEVPCVLFWRLVEPTIIAILGSWCYFSGHQIQERSLRSHILATWIVRRVSSLLTTQIISIEWYGVGDIDVTLKSVLVRSTHRSHVTTIYRSLSSRILTLFVYMELEILHRPLVETDIPAPYLTLVKFTTVR